VRQMKNMVMAWSVALATWGVFVGAAVSGAAHAKPAPWYWWASKHDGQRVCAQFMPEQGWVRAEGPFNNAQCRAQGAWVPRR